MKVYIVRERSGVNAKGEFDPTTRSLTVLKGNVLQTDVAFKSASTAANFVTGTSTNGLTAWKDKDGKTIKEIITEAEG